MVEMRTSDITAIITGGAQGIGREISRHFLINGYRVIIADIDSEAGQETEEELRGRSPATSGRSGRQARRYRCNGTLSGVG